jgi:hypothetical protein
MIHAARTFFTVLGFFFSLSSTAQNADALLARVKQKLAGVKSYEASGVLKTDVPFMKLPESKVTVYYKGPDRFKVKKQDGISIIPKGGINFHFQSMFSGDEYTAVAAGNATVNGRQLTIIKLLPLKENADVVLSTLYIDEQQALIQKANTTTRDNGTYEMQLTYGAYARFGLPDKVVFTFNLKDYKLPKGVTFEYDAGAQPSIPDKAANAKTKGSIEIMYSRYIVNKNIPDSVFQ